MRSTNSQNPYNVRDVTTMVPRTKNAHSRRCSLRDMRKLLSSAYISIRMAVVQAQGVRGTGGPA